MDSFNGSQQPLVTGSAIWGLNPEHFKGFVTKEEMNMLVKHRGVLISPERVFAPLFAGRKIHLYGEF